MRVALDMPPRVERRRVFPTWSIDLPVWFEETFDRRGNYWHAWDEDRSISLTSLVVSDGNGRSPRADEIVAMSPASVIAPGRLEDVDAPPGLVGWGAVVPRDEPTRAPTAVSGVVAIDGRLLLATITSADLEWARRIWLSIRVHRAAPDGRNLAIRPAVRHGRSRRRG